MNFYLSYGAGVGSEALRLWLLENNWPHEAVYVDHGCDWPETQEFVKTIPNLTVIKPNYQGYDNLLDYCISRNILPSIKHRWCTHHFKIEPLYRYFREPCVVYIGITIDEEKRMKNSNKDKVYNHYPLINLKMIRQDCVEYIESRNMVVPIRSSCWFCPFQTKSRWKQLKKDHFDLYNKIKVLEENKSYSISPQGYLDNITQEGQRNLW